MWRSVVVAITAANAGDPPAAWNVSVVADRSLAPFGSHEPLQPRTGYALCGHVHPGVRLTGTAGDSTRCPASCSDVAALLPAFGRLTGLACVTTAADESVVAIAGSRLFALPPQAAAFL
jgi:metallophosphoesterase superfamily enzyme